MTTTTAFSLPKEASPKIRALFDYWRSIHPAGDGQGGPVPALLPGRRHFDPIDIPELLPNIWMIDVLRDPRRSEVPRFRFRLIGTEIVKFTGRDATGQPLDAVYPDYPNTEAFRAHRAVAENGEPGYRKSGVLSNPGRDFVEAERLYLPLAEDGRTVDIILVMTLYKGDPPRR